MKYKYNPILLIYFLLFSCTEKEIEKIIKEVPPTYSWKLSNNYLFEHKIQTNSYADSNYLYTIGPHGLSVLSLKDTIEFSTHHYFSYDKSTEYKLPVNSNLFTAKTNNSVSFISTKNPLNSALGEVYINLPAIDSTFSHFNFPSYESGTCIGLSPDNEAVIPYYTKEHKSKILYVKIEGSGVAGNVLKLTKSVILDNINTGTHRLLDILYLNNNFYVMFSDKTLAISKEGKVEDLPRVFAPMFTSGSTIYGIAYAGLFEKTSGSNWSTKIKTANATLLQLGTLKYHYLGNNTLIATYNSQLFHVVINGTDLRLKEIDNSGLDGNEITSLARFKDRIYITTLSGLFYRKEVDFLTYK